MFRPFFFQEMKRAFSHGWKSKPARFYRAWLHHRNRHQVRKMNMMMFGKGGVFDKFAGKDGIM